VYDTHTVPHFYGIPKIHKEPVKMRPIIPCHSAIQNPAAKFVSKMLKPLIKAAPTIIHGSKDLAIKLSGLSFGKQRGKTLYVVTGDVVAYYPNIRVNRCIEIICQLWMEWNGWDSDFKGTGENKDATDNDRELTELLFRCLRVANDNLICQFQEKFYRALKGLAMGVACSPDLANLFGWFFERSCDVLSLPDVVFYGRYIDDCLGLVWANSEDEAIARLSPMKIDTCQITWSASRHSQPFLDMLVYIDENCKVQYTPYSKPRNHQERIPAISHHPEDVRRGTVIGEITRMATLSSTYENYRVALETLYALYLKRGYSKQWLDPIFKRYAQTRYEQRLSDKSLRSERLNDDVIVLKTEFNTAWDYFSADGLGKTITETWLEYLLNAENPHRPVDSRISADWGDLGATPGELTSEVVLHPERPVGDRFRLARLPDIRKLSFGTSARWLVSRRRTIQLKDMVSTWKNQVLSKYTVDANASFNGKGIPAKVERLPRIMETRSPSDSPEPAEQPTAVATHRPDVEWRGLVITGRRSPDENRTQLHDDDTIWIDLDL
jgi:hypothetical protein